MKKTISIGAVIVALTVIFIYSPRASLAPQPTSSPGTKSETSATLLVGTTSYPFNVRSGETVIDAMRALSSEGAFTFTGRDYPSLGFFVDSINGRANAGGMYWFLYVNGVSAASGASAVTVQPGDIIEWKYEKGL